MDGYSKSSVCRRSALKNGRSLSKIVDIINCLIIVDVARFCYQLGEDIANFFEFKLVLKSDILFLF